MTFDRFLQEVAPLQGLEWRKYRRRSARHRVEARIKELGLHGFEPYFDYLRYHPEELEGLPDLMLVTMTRFFRDRELWLTLAQTILPMLLQGKPGSEPLRAWSAGCCGGEEPYTLAMVWLESVAPLFPGCTLEVTASDIDQASLERARAGRYDMGSLREVPEETLARFFIREKPLWSVCEEVRGVVRLERRNVMSDPLPSAMDLVLCRYLAFTYYKGERLLAAALRLREALRPGGILMLGKKEQLAPPATLFFDPLPGCHGFYRRKDRVTEGAFWEDSDQP